MTPNPDACLVVTNDEYCVPGAPVETYVGRTMALRPDGNVLGRTSTPDVTIRIHGSGIGRRQARIWRTEHGWFLEELSRAYPVRLNEQLLPAPREAQVPLNDRDRLGFGHITFWFRIGTPWRAWLTPDVVALARCVSAERRFDALPILADALEEAGCDEPEVLNHCRTLRLGWRVSWVAELLHVQQVAADFYSESV